VEALCTCVCLTALCCVVLWWVQVSRTKEKLYEYQEELERQHREEEDRLMAQFHQERLVEAENMQKEFDTEWEQQLKALTDQYDGSQKKRDRTVFITIIH